ncbi:MAG: sigma-70 family RNA polymerase sigma factor [Verrucomicrobiota bacterium]|jgi:RNA polymerase sigma-70 factor (ECF subfamily)
MFTLDEDSAAPIYEAAGPSVPSASTQARLKQPLKASGDTAAGAPDILALTRAIRRGDEAAFARFYDLYGFRLYRFLLVLARGDENTAREVCQAAMTKLAKRFPVFDDERMLWAWLCALAKNSFIDHWRAQRRRDRFVSLEEMPASMAGAENSTCQLSEILREALAALQPEERELMLAAYMDGRPLQELADASGLTYKAVESRLARLRQKLKEQLLQKLRHENES